MIKLVGIIAAAFLGWIVVTMLMMVIDPFLAGQGIEPLANRAFLDKDALGVHLNMSEGVAFGAALLAAIGVGLKKSKGARRQRRR